MDQIGMRKRLERYQEIDSHFNKRHLDSRRMALAYGEFMTRTKSSAVYNERPAISDLCTNSMRRKAVSAPLVELSSSLPTDFEESTIGENIRNFKMAKGVEETEAEKELKAVGFIAYCRERTLEEAAEEQELSCCHKSSGNSTVTTDIRSLLHKAVIRDRARLKHGDAMASAKMKLIRAAIRKGFW